MIIKNIRLVDFLRKQIIGASIKIRGEKIKKIYYDEEINSKDDLIVDGRHKFAIPGLIDGHIHIESSHLTPFEFADLVIRFGTTTVISDPHEIVNVLGKKGFNYFYQQTEKLPIDVFFMAPSCVPASPFETNGGKFGLKEIQEVMRYPRVLGLAEVMNYPAVVKGEEEMILKIKTAKKLRKIIDGHCPGLRGKELESYIKAGVMSDHEATSFNEGLEKLKKGMFLMIREGSAAKNLEALLPLTKTKFINRLMFVTDDKDLVDLVNQGHLNWILKKAVAMGGDVFDSLRLVTFNPANYFQLNDRGLIKEGYLADLVLLDDLNDFNVFMTIKRGKVVYQRGEKKKKKRVEIETSLKKTIRVKKIKKGDFKILLRQNKLNRLENQSKVNCLVIKVINNQIVTEKEILAMPIKDNQVFPDPKKDVLKIAVIERHHKTGNIGLGLVKGFGFQNGALATTIAHDSHNIIVVGSDDELIYLAVKKLIKIGGGYVAVKHSPSLRSGLQTKQSSEVRNPESTRRFVGSGSWVKNNQVLFSVPMRVAGLMTDESWEEAFKKLTKFNEILKKEFRSSLTNPMMTLSFLSLPVIPKLKITDWGLFDGEKFEFVKLITT